MLYAEESNYILNSRKRVFKIAYQNLTVAQLSLTTNLFWISRYGVDIKAVRAVNWHVVSGSLSFSLLNLIAFECFRFLILSSVEII
jgi:hypothetical protein